MSLACRARGAHRRLARVVAAAAAFAAASAAVAVNAAAAAVATNPKVVPPERYLSFCS